MRPIPNNYALISKTEGMTPIFESIESEKLIEIPERWNLLFLDFDSEQFDFSMLGERPINILRYSEEMCCRLLNATDCSCPKNFDYKKKFFDWITDGILTLFKNNIEFLKSVKCNSLNEANGTALNFREKFKKIFSLNNKVVKIEDGILHMNLIGNVDINTGNGELNRVFVYDEDEGVTLKNGSDLKPVKPFFRVGVTHVSKLTYEFLCNYSG